MIGRCQEGGGGAVGGARVRAGRRGVGPGARARHVAGHAARARRRRALGRALAGRAARARARAAARAPPALAQRGARGAPRRAHQPPEVSRPRDTTDDTPLLSREPVARGRSRCARSSCRLDSWFPNRI